MKKILLSAILFVSAFAASSQSGTIVTPATNCFVFHNFNNSNEGFSSPSIYSSADDVTFNWDPVAGVEVETSGLSVRSGSLISPVYILTESGILTVGFRYEAPIGAEYRIRVVTGVIGSPIEVLATTSNGPVWSSLPNIAGNICLLLTDPDLVIGRAVRFEFTFRLNQPGDIVFDDLAMGASASTLPVTFQGFVARRNSDETLTLLWNVGEEQNVKGYYVESSINGLNFTHAGYVTATGKSIYSLDHPKPGQTIFFRVRNIDFDGASKYAPVIRVYTRGETNALIQLYPMPASDMVTLQHRQASTNAIISLYNLDGRLMQQVTASPFTLQTQLNIQKLARGIYIVRYADGQSDAQTTKLIKN